MVKNVLIIYLYLLKKQLLVKILGLCHNADKSIKLCSSFVFYDQNVNLVKINGL